MPANLFAILSLLIATAPSPPPRPWVPTPEMTEWVGHFVPETGTMDSRARALHRALVSRRGIGDSLQPAVSQTAEEAFAGREVDCVGFAFLYLGLARQLDLPAYFVLQKSRSPAGRMMGARVLEAHLAVGLWDGFEELVVDHGGLHDHRNFRFIEDDEAEAILWSNRGVRLAAQSECLPAISNLKRALRLTPNPDIARNLSVISSRCQSVLAAGTR